MKKNNRSIIPLLLTFLLFNLLIGCTKSTQSNTNNQSSLKTQGNDVREIVWAQLSKEEQDEIIGNWSAVKIEKVIANKGSKRYSLDDERLDGKEVYLITFISKNESLIGNVEKLVDIESNKIVGTAFRN